VEPNFLLRDPLALRRQTDKFAMIFDGRNVVRRKRHLSLLRPFVGSGIKFINESLDRCTQESPNK